MKKSSVFELEMEAILEAMVDASSQRCLRSPTITAVKNDLFEIKSQVLELVLKSFVDMIQIWYLYVKYIVDDLDIASYLRMGIII